MLQCYNVLKIDVQNGCFCPGYTAWPILASLQKWACIFNHVGSTFDRMWKRSSRSAGS